MKRLQHHWRRGAALCVCLLAVALSAQAALAQQTVRIAKQFGISYLPLTIIEEQKLLEKHAKAAGLDIATEWVRFTGGTPMNEALISGNLEFASGGVGPLLTIWGRTRGNLGVKAVAAINSMPLYLNTLNPTVKSIKDFSEKDRIALPAVRTSIQAITLQMAAEQAFGPGQHQKLDPLAVSMGHPDGHAAMMTGKSEITAHFTSAPYMYKQLEDGRVHKVLDSYEVLGGPHTFNVVWASTRTYDANPKLVKAMVAALEEAMALIEQKPAEMAALWVKAEDSKLIDAAEAEKIIKLDENEWTMTPKKIMAYADFMARAGILKEKPADWREVFFPEIHNLPGS